MKKLFWFVSACVLSIIFVSSCQEEIVLPDGSNIDCLSCQFTSLTLEDEFDVPNPLTAEAYAEQLFSIKNKMGKLSLNDIYAIGEPSKDLNLLYALLFVENLDETEILWSSQEVKDEANVEDRASAWKWTGGPSKWSLWCSGHKKWPAKKAIAFVNPCNAYTAGSIKYKCCSSLCSNNLPPQCN